METKKTSMPRGSRLVTIVLERTEMSKGCQRVRGGGSMSNLAKSSDPELYLMILSKRNTLPILITCEGEVRHHLRKRLYPDLNCCTLSRSSNLDKMLEHKINLMRLQV
eukprot:405907-Hanusia_phi.AAC.2